jgi:osmotically-inducible protein OsmY
LDAVYTSDLESIARCFTVTLKGSAGSSAEKDRAMQVARQFKGVRGVKDKIFVVE